MRRFIFLLVALALFLPAQAGATIRNATPANFNTVLHQAQAGDTVNLAAGTYPANYDPGFLCEAGERIIIRGTAALTSNVSLSPNGSQSACNQTWSRLHLTGAYIGTATTDFAIVNSHVSGQINVRDDHDNLQIKDNLIEGFEVCGSCYEGQVEVIASGTKIIGNEFTGQAADSIQDYGTGTQIIGNTFHDLRYDTPIHADPIQGLGHETLIAGNFFYSLPFVSVMMLGDGDRSSDFSIHDNVVAADDDRNYPFAITLIDAVQTKVFRNTMPEGECQFAITCGGLRMTTKSTSTDGDEFTAVTKNILGWASNEEQTTSIRVQNMVSEPPLAGSDFIGHPTFVGPLSSYCGYALTAGSAGQGRGARIDNYEQYHNC